MPWSPRLSPSDEKVLSALGPGRRAYLSAGSVEPVAFSQLLAAQPDRAAGLNLIGSFVPGVNRFDYAGLHPDARMTTLLLPEDLRASFELGRVDVLPVSYTGFAAYLERRPPEVAVVQLTPADASGISSFGPAADFAPIAWRNARFRIAYVNPSLPRPPGGLTVPLAMADIVVECDHPPLAVPPGATSPVLQQIAEQVANLVEDGACVQAGLGGAPAAALAALTSRRNLTVHSGMVSDEYMTLHQAGALAPDGHVAGVAIGSAAFYTWLGSAEGLAFASTPQTHGARALAQLDRFTAINSALEVDLFGQANLEWRNGRLASGMGGAPDFIAGAQLSAGGRSIVALPATAKGRSRIVARLGAPTVSIPRNLIDTVVTEHGVAEIRDLPLEARAQKLIAVAAPEHQSTLQREWEDIRNRI